VKTTAIVNNGEMIILGGLIKNSGGKGVSKVPFLGDIPVLGEMLFTHTTDASRETNVVIYLTPYIVRRSDELQKLKKHLEKLEAIQERYNRLIGEVLEKRADGELPEIAPVAPAARRIKHVPDGPIKIYSDPKGLMEAF
jgi:general secretion pathway protein D